MDAQTLELLSWVSREPRTYPEAIEVWRTHCPRHSVWEDALGDGLIQVFRNGRESQVALTALGETALGAAGLRFQPEPGLGLKRFDLEPGSG